MIKQIDEDDLRLAGFSKDAEINRLKKDCDKLKKDKQKLQDFQDQWWGELINLYNKIDSLQGNLVVMFIKTLIK